MKLILLTRDQDNYYLFLKRKKLINGINCKIKIENIESGIKEYTVYEIDNGGKRKK